jgi:hypothetical protein
MSSIRQGLGYRLAWSGFAALLCLYSLHGAISSASWGQGITALAWGLFAVAWFLQPLVASASSANALRGSAALGIGSVKLRAGLGYAALGLLVVGIVVRTSGA